MSGVKGQATASHTNDPADFPHTVAGVELEGYRVRRNDLVGALVVIERLGGPLDPTLSYTVSRKDAESAHTETGARRTSLAQAKSAYAEAWLRSVACSIGLGFHPDTRAGSYEPPLPRDLSEQYDDMIEYVFGNLADDPYEVSLQAWTDAGLIEPSPEP